MKNFFRVGQIIDAFGPPDASWLLCNGAILVQADYPAYVRECGDLHPFRWSCFSFKDIDNSSQYTRRAIISIGDYVVIVGDNNLVNYSSDGGDSWDTSTLNSTNVHYDLATDGTIIVATEYSAEYAEYSDDYGESWTRVSCPGSTSWRFIAYNGTYFLVAHYGSVSPHPLVCRSSDGINWTQITLSSLPAGAVRALEVDDSGNFLMYLNGADGYEIYTSSDGETWSSPSIPLYLSYEEEGDLFTFFKYLKSNWYIFSSYKPQFILTSANGLENYKYYPFNGPALIDAKVINDEIIFCSTSNFYISSNGIDNAQMRLIPYGSYSAMATDESDWIILVGNVTGYKHLITKVEFSSYDSSTYFQLPLFSFDKVSGKHKYIKVK